MSATPKTSPARSAVFGDIAFGSGRSSASWMSGIERARSTYCT